MILDNYIFLIVPFFVINVTFAANPDGSCTNPMFRWFKELDAFYNYTRSVNQTNGRGNATIPAIRINISMDTNARCLDGSQYFFYFRQGFGDGINKYQIYLQGGGWCTSLQSCYNRAQPSNYVGSSLDYTKYAWYSADYLDDNQTNNPLMYNWNTIWMIYCDGSSFTGNNLTVSKYNSKDLYFRGHINLKEGMDVLYNKYGLDSATDVVLSGCSAGGMAVYLNNDFIFRNYVTPTAQKKFMSIPASGFFPYNNPIHSSSWHNGILWIYDTQNVTNNLNIDCVNYYKQTNETLISHCMFSQYVSAFLNKNKIFALQSIYDAAGMSEQGINTKNDNQSTEYGEWYANLFIQDFVNVNISLHGGLLYSCYSHCGEYNDINVSNILAGNGIEMFYNGDLPHVYKNTNLIFQNHSYPCNQCCFPNYVVPPPANITVCRHNNELCDPICA